MTDADVIAVTREAIWVLLLVSSPLLILAMTVGLIISFVQALTQIQEATISFVPKILIMFAAMIFLLPFMSRTLVDFGQSLQTRIIAVGQSEAP